MVVITPDVIEASVSSTPRARPQLTNFSNRTYTASPLGPNNRLSTPQSQRQHGPSSSPSRRYRDNLSRSRLNASTTIRSGPAAPHAGGASRLNVFAPGVSPSPKKSRASSSDAPHTPSRGGPWIRSTNPDLFVQSIPDPPQDLTGQALSQHLPGHLLEQRATVYADQYLSHLCPQDFGDEQRRQFFCILDLRRLKFAATEIFAKKDWRLNVMNFAKEFEKSRSMILLRYGLYEFKNVRPSADVLKKWRAAHNLPDPEDDTSVPDGTRQNGFPTATKRKADDDLSRHGALQAASPSKANKRRAVDVDDSSESDAHGLMASNHKRKATVTDHVDDGDEPPSPKLQKSQSSTRSFFESIGRSASASTPTSKPSTHVPGTAPAPKQNAFTSSDKPSLFFASAAKPSNGASKSIFENVKPGSLQPPNTGNIFGYLSDSSAKNSFADPESSDDEAEAQETPVGSKPGLVASGKAETPAMNGGLFGAKQASGLSATAASAAQAAPYESAPRRSLLDRIETEKDEEPAEKPAPTNQTWTAGTPIKFGTSTTPEQDATKPASNAFSFGSSTATPTASMSQSKTNNLFGAGPATPAPIPTSKPSDVPVPPMTAPPKTGLFGAKPKESEKAASNLFGAKPAETDAPAAPSAPTLSFSAAPSDIFGAPKTASNAGLFQGSYTAPAATTAAEKKDPPPSAIFGAANPGSKAGLFQGNYKPSPSPSPAPESKPEQPAPATGLFGMSQPAESKPLTGLFGAASTPAPTAGLFGASQPAPSKPETATGLFGSTAQPPSTPKLSSKTATPVFGFGGTAVTEIKPVESTTLFGSSNNGSGPFGSPMKTDESPSKKPAPAPASSLFAFGASAAPPASSHIFSSSTISENKAGSSGIFSNVNAGNENKSSLFSFASNAPTEKAPGNMFGGTSFASTAPPGSASSSFTFGAVGNDSNGGQSFNNPFATANNNINNNMNNAAPDSASSSFDFNFGGPPAAPTPGGGSSFVFGAGAGSQPTPNTSGMFSFGGNTGGGLATPSGRKRGASPALAGTKKPFTASAAPKPSFSFTASTPQPAQSQPQSMSFSFGASQPPQNQPVSSIFSNLRPPAGGASTTGTNSPFVFGGSSVATTPAAGTTPEPSSQPSQPSQAEATTTGDAEPPQEQIDLTAGGPGEEAETVLHEVRAKAMKFIPPGSDESDNNEPDAKKSPWATQGVGPLRLLQNKETGTVRLLLRAEPRGHIAMNRAVLAVEKYAAKEKYVTVMTSNESGSGLETWMLQVKTREMATALAAALEEHKSANRQ